MIKIENAEVTGWEAAIRGMRNPMNSWEKSDSRECIDSCDDCDNFSICNSNAEQYFKKFWEGGRSVVTDYAIGPDDHDLMMLLANGGSVHAKYRRMIAVYVDITAPLYWWKEFDTYKVGTVTNSCSTMHKIHEKEFTLDDFSHEHLLFVDSELEDYVEDRKEENRWAAMNPTHVLNIIVGTLNYYRERFNKTKDRKYWLQMIQLLPSSYNQKRTVMLNYEVLHNIYISRRYHKLDEWRAFCKWIESLPYSELITGEKEN